MRLAILFPSTMMRSKKIDQKNVPDDQKDAYYAEIIFIDPDVKRYYSKLTPCFHCFGIHWSGRCGPVGAGGEI